MKKLIVLLALLGCGSPKPVAQNTKEVPVDGGKFYSFTMKNIDGKDVNLGEYKGKVLMLVNVASECGNTPQYEGLQKIYDKYHAKGFEVLGFPANNFGGQEPGTESQIKEFCKTHYGIKFPMFAKISVKGADKHPLYKYLNEETDFKGEIGWNFGKYLVNKEGKTIGYFSPSTQPEAPEVTEAIQKAL